MVKNALCRTILRGFFITLTSRRAEQRIRIFVTQTQECSENSFTVMFFVSNNIPRALRKYRTANDREIHYGNDRGRFSLFCYGYIFEAINIRRAKFIDVGIGRNQVNGHECTGQSSLPVMPRGCYKITYNGMGIQNATATWVPL